MRFTLVDLYNVAYKDKPFIMSEQAKQVFYVQHLCSSKLSMVLQGRIRGVTHENQDSTLDFCDTPSFSICMPSIQAKNEVDDIHANRNDHYEGLWENIPALLCFR